MSIKQIQLLLCIGIFINITLSVLKLKNPFEKFAGVGDIGIFLFAAYLIISFFVYKKSKS
ncbi:hypothetical protein J2Z35_002278 [Acetoanaerobium pronyense]|uniref:Uncharacterized protein n=1 Tax=Acetoanaerobium pronyense TaxID=1482736 RepID=A0ABS4KL47_9FIRM|nr:hypothetical protein [Acetoanaerobium pronyense]MBP2028475.1 hypothetical protein [Acetoanaerobium pronyense]